MSRKFLPPLLAAASACLLLSCSAGMDSDPSSLSPPVIAAGDAPVACGSAGTTSIVLELLATEVYENHPVPVAGRPDLGASYVTITGSVNGLPAGAAVYGLVIDDLVTCPVISAYEFPMTADGAFTEHLRITTTTGLLVDRFRVIVVAGADGATVGCPAGEDCLHLDVGGTFTPPAGISNAIFVRL